MRLRPGSFTPDASCVTFNASSCVDKVRMTCESTLPPGNQVPRSRRGVTQVVREGESKKPADPGFRPGVQTSRGPNSHPEKCGDRIEFEKVGGQYPLPLLDPREETEENATPSEDLSLHPMQCEKRVFLLPTKDEIVSEQKNACISFGDTCYFLVSGATFSRFFAHQWTKPR